MLRTWHYCRTKERRLCPIMCLSIRENQRYLQRSLFFECDETHCSAAAVSNSSQTWAAWGQKLSTVCAVCIPACISASDWAFVVIYVCGGLRNVCVSEGGKQPHTKQVEALCLATHQPMAMHTQDGLILQRPARRSGGKHVVSILEGLLPPSLLLHWIPSLSCVLETGKRQIQASQGGHPSGEKCHGWLFLPPFVWCFCEENVR